MSWRDRKAILPHQSDLPGREWQHGAAPAKFEAVYGNCYPAIWQSGLGFGPSIREMIYATNAVEALTRSLRKIARGSFPDDDATLNLLFLGIKNAGPATAVGEGVERPGRAPIQFGCRLRRSPS